VPRQNDVSVFSSLKDIVVRVFAFLGNLWRSETSNRPMLAERKSTTNILHPQGPFLQKWNKIFVISCIFAVSVDALFFYIPVINDEEPCWYLDSKLKITASVLRSFTDIFYILHIIFQFRTGFVSSSPTASGRSVLIEDRYEITKWYLSTYFLIDVFAVIPLPQVLCVKHLPSGTI
jgi:cyclic nucleotide gated channel, plant